MIKIKKKKLTKLEKWVLNSEKWKPIVLDGIMTSYEVSDKGQIRNADNFTHLQGSTDKRGYQVVSLYVDKKLKTKSIHRLVAQAFIPNPENKPTVNHIDGNKQNNRVENLEWATHDENIKHALRTGLRDLRGTKSVSNKYTEDQVRKVCELLSLGIPHRKIAKILNVNPNLPRRILYQGKWSYISKDYDFPKYKFNKNLVDYKNKIYAID